MEAAMDAVLEDLFFFFFPHARKLTSCTVEFRTDPRPESRDRASEGSDYSQGGWRKMPQTELGEPGKFD